jgi:hypothetical protein
LYFNVHAQASLPFAHLTESVYRPRGINALQLLFKRHFQSIAEQYESKYALVYGRFRIERITEVVEKFVLCGDYSQGTSTGCRSIFDG